MPHFPKNYFIRVQFIVFIFVQQQVYPHTCHSPLSDLWYPHSSAQLRSMLVALYDKAANHYDASVPATAIRAVVVPHAGYAYSGEVAASVYRLLQGSSFKRVIILGPLHTRSFTGIAVPSCTTYATPLGSLSLDTKVLKALSHNALFVYNDALFLQEHSLDVQLPFVYKSMPSCKIVPLLVGTLSYQQIEQTVQALMPYIDATTLVVVSSDFVHYGKRFSYEPFKTQQAGLAESIMHLNAQALHFLPYGTVQDFLQFIDATQATICGALPLAILIALKKAGVFQNGSSHLISYATSADKGDDATGQVSYVGLVLSDTGLPRDTELVFLTQYEKKSLLQLARSVIEQAFVKKVPRALLYPIISDDLAVHRGVFVTLRKDGQLRGCIGTFATDKPLYEAVADMALSTAFHDTRFSPLAHKELAECTITISVLTASRPIARYQDIVLGKHGIILHHGTAQAVFLPEVPGEFGWDLPTTLTELSIKAGLPAQAWRDKNATFEVFEAVDFGE